MKKLLLILITFAGVNSMLGQSQLCFSAEFFQGQVPSNAVCNDWLDFVNSLDPGNTYISATMSGTFDPTGVSITDPAAASALANLMFTKTNGSVTSGADTWTVDIGCTTGSSCDLAQGVSIGINSGGCSCVTGYEFRPAIGNSNWGGVNSTTCFAPTQTMTMCFNLMASGPLSIMCPPDTTVDCNTDTSAMVLGTATAMGSSGGGTGGGQVLAMVRAVGSGPWGQASRLQQEMDDVFGAGNWTEEFFSTVNVSDLLSQNGFIYLEGSDGTATAFNNFLQANLTAFENWVSNGGVLFMNAAPNQGGNINFGFGGVTLVYPGFSGSVFASQPAHPVFTGPFQPTATNMTGNSYGHSILCPPGAPMNVIIEEVGSNDDVLVELPFGSGLAIFGGMTTTNFHSPNPQAENAKRNILAYGQANMGMGGSGGRLLFSQDNNPNGLYELDFNTGMATNIGASGVTSGNNGITFSDDPALLYGSMPFGILQINSDGSGFVSLGGETAEGMAWDEINDVLYASINGSFFTVNENTGARITTLPSPPGSQDVEGLAWDRGDIIYGLADGTGAIHAYSISGNSWSTVGSTGINFQSSALAYNPGAGVLYATGLQDDQLYEIDPATAVATAIGSMGLGNVGGGLAFGGASAGNCGIPTVSYEDVVIPGGCPQEFVIERTWTAVDECGTTAECVQTITVQDTSSPDVVCVANLTTIDLDETGMYQLTPEELYESLSDNCSANADLTFTITPNDGLLSCGDVGMVTVTLTVEDECQNTSECVYVVEVRDVTPPVLTCPGDREIYLGADECDQIIVFDEPTATDACDQDGVVGSLTTLFAANNGQAGNMFNITNLGTGALPITMFDINIDPGTHTFRLYFSPGGFAGKETNPGAWTQVGELLVTSNGFNQPTPFNLGFTIPAGETYGVYITEIGGTAINYTNGGPNTFNDGVIEITTGPGNFGLFGGTFFPRQWNGTVYYELPARVTTVERLDTNGFVSGDLFPIGEHCFRYRATDSNGNSSECEWCFTVIDYQDPVQTLQCNNRITLGLDNTCMIDLNADMILEGGPYGCPDRYPVVVRDDRGNIMDLDGDPSNGTQLGAPHIGKCFEVQVTHPDNGVRCWGTVCIEDKLPPVIVDCPDVTVTCEQGTDPGSIPGPTATDACDPILDVSFVDWVTDGSCDDGYERIISRRWTFTDDNGNSATCEQTIRVELIGLFDIVVPANYDDLANPALECDEKYDASKDVSGHILDAPFCVDGYLLDSALWLATGGDPALGDLSGTRLPMTLGWNCIENGPYAGHPSPFGIFYEPHPQWELLRLCWGPDQVTQWIGTGLPSGTGCSNIEYTYADTKIELADPTCDAGEIGCYKILRQWTLIDWCTGEVGGHDQIIKVLDKKAPEIVVPDRLEVGTDVWKCEGIIQVPAPWITDNCSEDLDYAVTVKTGQVIGNSATGYTVVGLALGEHTLYIEAFDCCGNTGLDSIILDVVDNTPPICISEDRVQLSLAGNQSPGSNFSAICADELDQASYDNCTDWVWFKMIRMDELLGTVNGSFAPNDMACGGVNGDDDALISGNQVYYDDCSKFCCEDADQIIMVVLRVHDVDPGAGPVNPLRYTPPGGDLVGHFTDCWVEIDVRDKAQPIVVAPPDMVVSCMFWFDDSEDALEDVNNPTFGRVVTDLGQREKVKTIDVVCEEWCEDHPKYDYEPSRDRPAIWRQACDFYDLYFDPAHPDDKYELVWGFDGYAIRTCGAQPTIRVDDRRECGQGVINRDVIVSFQDPKTGGVVTYRDRQEIWVIDCDPFFVSEDCFDDEDCIDWPLFCQQPDPIDGCGADLDPYTNPDLGFPVVQNGCDDNCALIVVEYNDEILTVEPDACFKVIRTWIVIDWCQYDPLAGRDDDGDNPNQVADGRWEYIQVINVRDKIDPVVSIEIGDCEPAVKDTATGVCLGRLELCATATDECSPDDWIVYDYKIDAFSDGVGQFGDFDFYVGKLTLKQFNGGTSLTQGPLDCDAYNQGGYCNPFAEDPTQPFCATGTYPVGVHTIYWFAEDGCGNVTKDTAQFEILDCKAPTPYCKTGIISVVMPVNGEICIWAIDLDDGSFDNCTEQENLKFYFNGDPNWVEYCINCDTFEARGADDKVLIDVQVWVEDEEGNTDFCITTIEIQDNQDICDNSGSIIAGNVENAMVGDMVEYVEMSLNSGMMVDVTDVEGEYTFTGWEMNKDYTVSAYRNDDPLNGVSTKDLVAIQRHLLGHSPFVSGYQMIAADVNNNADVSAADISALRRVILGTTADFSQWNDQTSWRFVDANENLTDNTDPWPFTEELSYTDVATNMYAIDLDAVKVGDVTGDAASNGAVSNSTRSNGQLILAVEDADIVAGDSYVMEVTSENFDAIAGYQFTMKYDANALNFSGINSGAITVTEGNLGLQGLADGVITMSWNDANGQATTVTDGQVLFTITFDAALNAKASDVIRATSEITKAEAYGADLDDRGLTIEFRNGNRVVEVFELYQNTPNPFEGTTVISYTLPQDMPAVLTVYDVAGKVVLVKEVSGEKGYNEVEMSKAQLNGAGVLYYQLDAANHTATKRMVLID